MVPIFTQATVSIALDIDTSFADARDRFGTRLEQRFTRAQIETRVGNALKWLADKPQHQKIAAQLEPSLAKAGDESFQFERHGYYKRDGQHFVQTVGLKDSWQKKA